MSPENGKERKGLAQITCWAISRDLHWIRAIKDVSPQIGTLIVLSPEEIANQEEKVKKGEALEPDVFLIDATDMNELVELVKGFSVRHKQVHGVVFAANYDLMEALDIIHANHRCAYQPKTYDRQKVGQDFTAIVNNLISSGEKDLSGK